LQASDNWSIATERLHDSRIVRAFRQAGYRYVHAGSWWEGTRTTCDADTLFTAAPTNEFTRRFIQTTALYPLLRGTGLFSLLHRQHQRVNEKFRFLATLPGIDPPRFVFAHFLVPHPPYVFDDDGRFVPGEESWRRTEADAYARQLRYTNGQIIELIDALIERSEVPPIIILQADEGPYPDERKTEYSTWDWTEATPEAIRCKTGILNAWRVPTHPDLAPPLSAVNTFPLLLRECFGADLANLPDRRYVMTAEGRPYDLIDVTEKAERR
jgi:hypothetical protein